MNQFGSVKPVRSGKGMSCAECEAMLTDAIDNTLSARDRAAFDLHISTCKECSQMLADAQRGAALLEMLKRPRPEPSSALLERILAQTSGQNGGLTAQSTAVGPVLVAPIATARIPASVPGIATGNVIPFTSARKFSLQAITRTMMQPRLAMTAAMAFFSIALTLNLTGVHLSELKASDLKPSNIRHTFYQADASIVRYYTNLRVVYELESRVSDLKAASESDNQSNKSESQSDSSKSDSNKPKSNQDQQKKAPKSGSGTSLRRNPFQPEFKLVATAPPSLSESVISTAVTRSGEPPAFVSVLAGNNRTTSSPLQSFGNRFNAPRLIANKSKESLNEGGLA